MNENTASATAVLEAPQRDNDRHEFFDPFDVFEAPVSEPHGVEGAQFGTP